MKRKKPLIITPKMEEILRAVHFYRYMTVTDITHLFYSPKSISHGREVLSKLCGGEDENTNQYLFRFCPPSTRSNSERVYTLGSRGRDYVGKDLGLPVDWYYRPGKTTHRSYHQIEHDLILTRFLVASEVWCRKQKALRISQKRICYELAKTPARVAIDFEGRQTMLKVIPDAWLEIQKERAGKLPADFRILLEIDRGTFFQKSFKEHILSRIEFVGSGLYRKMFGTEAVLIAYVTAGGNMTQREKRRATLCAWTKDLLNELGIEWASMFRFHALSLDDIYTANTFEGKVWYRPDSPSPLMLFS